MLTYTRAGTIAAIEKRRLVALPSPTPWEGGK